MIRPPPRSTLFPSPPLFRSPFLPPAACCRRFPKPAPPRPPHPHSRANRFSAFLAPASPPRVPLSPRARRSPELQFRNALSASPPPRQRHSRHQNRSWLAVGLPHSHGTALPPMRKRVVSPEVQCRGYAEGLQR